MRTTWQPISDPFGTGVHQVRWWRDPAGEEHLVHTHGYGSTKPGEAVVSGRNLLSGRKLTFAVINGHSDWQLGTPDPTWDEVQRITGIPTKQHQDGHRYRGLPHYYADALDCHPVAAAARVLLEQHDLPAGVVSCPDCCRTGRSDCLIGYAWDSLAVRIADTTDCSRQPPEHAFRLTFEDQFERFTYCHHRTPRWGLDEAWHNTGWAGAQLELGQLARAEV